MNTREWIEMGEQVSPERRETFLAMETPVMIAAATVEGLRRARAAGVLGSFTARQAGLGLLFAGVRVLALMGVPRERLVSVAGSFWDLTAPERAAPVDDGRG